MGGMGLLDKQITQANYDALGCNGWKISAYANSAPQAINPFRASATLGYEATQKQR